ncbi:hypothetical protein GA0074696_3165 [Micromonospora purpureochromogenes]|uniref:LPXTG-motif cell wall anchor domain-containing protein n=1 Tax=Micromonospora purpureochromogenes TaxID=47872 RepID=A0A1C4Y9W4_9ACTN|nr:hypothetical protein [Micromonospora purpureochromogenes]SCF17460.1 hypothetical protein GA0074696_3165 [Micromonospora purpureochromogenes]
MRLSRIIMALTAGLAVVLAPTAAGAAQPQPAPDYPPQPPALTASPTTVVVGEVIVLTGTGFGPNEIVDIDVTVAPLAASVPGQPARRSDGSTVAMAAVAYPQPAPRHFTAHTNAAGRFIKHYRPTEVGQLTFTATGRESGRTASVTVTVLPKKRHGGGNLPVTGDSMGTPLKVGGGLVGAGAVLMLGSLVWRRRNRFGMGSTR